MVSRRPSCSAPLATFIIVVTDNPPPKAPNCSKRGRPRPSGWFIERRHYGPITRFPHVPDTAGHVASARALSVNWFFWSWASSLFTCSVGRSNGVGGVVCWDASATLLLSHDDDLTQRFRQFFPEAVDLNEHNKQAPPNKRMEPPRRRS